MSDLDSLPGTCVITSLEVDGRPMGTSNARMAVAGHRFTTESMGATYLGNIELNPAADPKAFATFPGSGLALETLQRQAD